MTHSINSEPGEPERGASGSLTNWPPNSPAGKESVPPHSSSTHEQGDPLWMFLGPQGLRAGWSVLLFVALLYLFANIFGTFVSFLLANVLQVQPAEQTAASSVVSESPWVLGLAATMAIMARLERRRFLDYFLTDPAATGRFVSGFISGFAALSVLVAVMAWGGWIRFGPAPHDLAHLLKYAGLWALAFLLVALTEEGTFRCYLQFTLTRGINFWWALAAVSGMCLWDFIHSASHGTAGIYAMAALGLIPCLYLHLSQSPRGSFGQAAWAGSTLFGFIHTGNNGETWIGILAAGAIGFVFCVSVRLTGSAWWAIGCHAAWDWAESYFYGTADSGFVARGHLLTTTPAGSAWWSGGTDGPEGSVLILPIVALLLLALVLLYGRKRRDFAAVPVAENVAS
jgi:hypothetical protein